MKWENVNLHLENLLPGLVTFVLLSVLLPCSIANLLTRNLPQTLLSNEFVAAGIFVGAAYLLGVVAVVVGRLLVDRPSEWFPRPFLLWVFSRPRPKWKDSKFKDLNENYRAALKTALRNANEEVKAEVLKRRERGRLVRTTLIPTLLVVIALTDGTSLCTRAIFVLVAYLLQLFLYAYSEVCVNEECLLV